MFKTAAALAAVTAMAVSLPAAAGAPGSAPAQQRDDLAVQAHALPIGAQQLEPAPGGARSARLETRPFTMVALTWQGAATPQVEVRTRTEGTWTDWHDLHLLTGPAADRTGTELLWAGRSDGVQVRLNGDAGRRTRIHLVDSATPPADARSAGGRMGQAPSPDTADTADPADAPQPKIRSRGDWGADESWRSGAPVYNDTIKQAHVHHTATSGTYTRSEVPAMLRGLYFYHTQVLGWSDLGYNFVVDRFGRIWEGRAGGVGRAVRGAHTLGFNHASFGVAALGEYDHTRPSPELLRGLVRLSAWKLDAYDRDPAGYARVRSEGSDRYPEGQWVRLPVIDGHRDTNETACPGERLYAELPEIRRRAQRRADAVFPGRLSTLR